MWSDPPTNLILGAAELDVWRAILEIDREPVHSYSQLLSDEEIEHANRFRFEIDGRHFIASRSILRRLIGRYLNTNPAGIVFESGEFGKPYIRGKHGFEFNISHSGGRALFAFSRNRPLGVDLEFTKRKIEIFEVASKFFTPSEVRELSRLPEKDQKSGFFSCWTRKEAFIKAIGSGLSFPLDKFAVTLTPGEDTKLLRTIWDPAEAKRWALYSFLPAKDFIGALAVRENKKNLNLNLYDFPGPD